MPARELPRVLLLDSHENTIGEELSAACKDELKKLGCAVEFISELGAAPPVFDLLLGYGPMTMRSSILPAEAWALLKPAQGRRPRFVWWLTEGLSDPRFPTWWIDQAAKARRWMDEWAAQGQVHSRWIRRLHLAEPWPRRGRRLRIFAELRWLQSQGLLDLIAVTSELRAAHLRPFGFDLITVPLGYHPIYGQDLNTPRDIDVCVLGGDTRRRRRLLQGVRQALEGMQIQVALQSQLFGSQRTAYLNRTKIMLNFLLTPHDFTGLRFIIAAANKVLVVTEPMLDSAPFVADRHFVVASPKEMADRVLYYLNHEQERRAIVDEAYRFVTQDLTMGKMIGRLLSHSGFMTAPAG